MMDLQKLLDECSGYIRVLTYLRYFDIVVTAVSLLLLYLLFRDIRSFAEMHCF